jgi:hypothetical protein
MGGRAAVERLLDEPYPHASTRNRSGGGSFSHSDHGGLEHRRSSLFPSAQQRVAAWDLPTRRVDRATSDGVGHGDLHTKVSPATVLFFGTSIRSILSFYLLW